MTPLVRPSFAKIRATRDRQGYAVVASAATQATLVFLRDRAVRGTFPPGALFFVGEELEVIERDQLKGPALQAVVDAKRVFPGVRLLAKPPSGGAAFTSLGGTAC